VARQLRRYRPVVSPVVTPVVSPVVSPVQGAADGSVGGTFSRYARLWFGTLHGRKHMIIGLA
jgi:hypothetical protein